MAKKNPHLQLTVTPRDIEFGRLADEHTAQRAIDLETHPLRVARRKADEADIPQGKYIGPATNFVIPEQRTKDFEQRLEKGMVAAPAAGAAALTSGAWLGPAARMVIEGTKNPAAIAAMSGIGAGTEMLEDKPSPLGAAAKAAQWAAMARMPISEALTYVPEAEASTLGGVLGLLRDKASKRAAAQLFERAPGVAAFTDKAVADAILSGSKFRPMVAGQFHDATFLMDDAVKGEQGQLDALRQAAKSGELVNIPRLTVGKGNLPSGYRIIIDHDGRHRMQAISDAGNNPQTPVIITPDRGQRLSRSLVWPQAADRELFGTKLDNADMLDEYFGGREFEFDPKDLISRAHGGSVQKFAGGGLALLRKALTGQLAKDVGTTGVIKEKGGNWLSGSDWWSGSVEGTLSGLKRNVEGVSDITPEMIAEHRDVAGVDLRPKAAINNFIDKQLTRYVKNDMATPGDPIRALAERGVLHVDPNTIPIRNLVHPSGEETRKLGVSEAAKRWENRSDRAIAFNPASDYQDFGHSNMTREHPWVAKLDPTTPIYRFFEPGISIHDLGFNHLIDELSNALNPESGLPRHLLLDPKSLDRVSVPQAVERVAKINEWRAAQKAEADALKANNAATVLHKEYPENNPMGLRWVELKKQDLPEGWVQEGLAYANPADPKAKWIYPEETLADALRYEGDTMGHCVGGYCDDVLSGRSRIYSLRDAKGQPHVTIEVQPMKAGYLPEPSADPSAEIAPRIVQIKGKQNRAPNPEYLPFVQDFVRSGQWSDVGDLQNAGLFRVQPGQKWPGFSEEMPAGYWSIEDAEKQAVEKGMDPEVLQSWLNRLRNPNRYASGGSVQKFAGGGLARLASRLAADSAPARRGVADVVKEKGGNWLSGSVEGALSGLKPGPTRYSREELDQASDILRRAASGEVPGISDLAAANRNYSDFSRKRAMADFIDKQLTRYVKNDMATPEDPVRALAERGVLHFPARERNPGPVVTRDRLAAGFPEEGVAQSQLAKNWEDTSDKAIWSDKVGNIPYTDQLPDWIKKLKVEKPSAIHHTMNRGIANDDLGFNHLIDELSNAINPESGLPRHLQFPADRLGRVSVPQAVERVAEINAWRAAQKAEADAAKANNAATVLHKEYPEKGLKWVELKQPQDLPEGWELGKPSAFGEPTYRRIGSLNNELRDPRIQTLADALKYEGDTMGHCVGGYCDDVASGRSRIYSLRDAKGQPHVTIEVAPERTRNANEWYAWQKQNPEEYAKLNEEFGEDMGAKLKAAAERYKEPPRIVQIKGKQNRAPNPEYLPFVQDFVKSGQWSDVGDLQNAGLVKMTNGQYMTEAEYQALKEAQGYASGGQVKNSLPDFTNPAIINAIFKELQHG